MTSNIVVLAQGQISNSPNGVLHTVAGGRGAVVRYFSIHATQAAQTVDVWLRKASGTARRIAHAVLANGQTWHPLDGDILPLGAADEIQAQTTDNLACDFNISGLDVPSSHQTEILANSQVTTSQAAIFTASGENAIRFASFYNLNAATQTLEIWLKKSGGTARKLENVTLLQHETYRLNCGDALGLANGDSLEAKTTTTAAVDFAICGRRF